MSQYYIEYIWLDGSNPQQLRSKTKVVSAKSIEKEKKIPNWNFDGSSTGQSDTSKSELILVPTSSRVKYKDPFRENGFLVMCEVFNPDMTPHSTNTRSQLRNLIEDNDIEDNCMFGFEQEYIIFDRNAPRLFHLEENKAEFNGLGWPVNHYPRPQGDYYCGVGANNVIGRDFVDEHAALCLKSGIKYGGSNAEVLLSQWEYQVGPVYGLDGSDQLWISRWILHRLSEKYGYMISLHPKPFVGNRWNGSGMHVNFSTSEMREDMSLKKELAIEACELLSKSISEHIEVYGEDNNLRLTGENETCSIDEFRWGIGDRTASIRIPSSINDDFTPGYIEDRRPASNADPYQICYQLIKSVVFSGVAVSEIMNSK